MLNAFYPGDSVEFYWCPFDADTTLGDIVGYSDNPEKPYRVRYMVSGKYYTDLFRESELTRIG